MSPLEIIRRPFFLPLLTLILIILSHNHFFPTPPLNRSWLNQPFLMEGQIKSKERTDNKTKITIDLALPTQGRILLTIPEAKIKFNTGDRIQFFSSLKLPRSYKNPGVFDYVDYLSHKGLQATAFVESESQIILIQKGSFSFFKNGSENFKKRLEKAFGKKGNGILKALLWGDDSDITPETEKLFQDNGLTHLLVISGMHFGAMGALTFGLVLLFLKTKPAWLLYIPGRKIAASISIILLTAYFFFCEPSPSLTRGLIASACFFTAILLNRPRDWVNILFASAFFILLIHPQDLFSISFQLSFVAVGSLLTIFPILHKKLSVFSTQVTGNQNSSWGFKKIAQSFESLILLQVAMLFGLTPLLLFYFHRFQWTGFLMNLWATPLIELIIVPSGLLGLGINLFSTKFSTIIFWFDQKMIEGVIYILQKSQNFFHPPFLVFPPHGWELALYYTTLVLLIISISQKLKKIVVLVAVLIFTVDAAYVIRHGWFDNSIRMTQIDVGQGDSILLELPGAHRYLIDGGGSPYFDIGDNVLIPYLLHERIPYLNAVAVTHADTDHYLGLITLLKEYPVHEFWWNGFPDNSPDYQKLMSAVEKIPTLVLKKGQTPVADTNFRIDVLSPFENSPASDKDNNRSLVLKIQAGDFTALLTGDLESLGEMRLLEAYTPDDLKSKILKVGHHGSKTSTSERFLEAVKPEVVTIGVGEANRFHHPHPSVLERLQSKKIPIYRTDKNGTITLSWENGFLKTTLFNK